jgi:hypothetical protein
MELCNEVIVEQLRHVTKLQMLFKPFQFYLGFHSSKAYNERIRKKAQKAQAFITVIVIVAIQALTRIVLPQSTIKNP